MFVIDVMFLYNICFLTHTYIRKWNISIKSNKESDVNKLLMHIGLGMKTDGKTPLPFPYPYFIIGNGIETGIVGNENRSGINGIAKTNGNGNTNGNS